jgi:hypothetical protein
MNFELISEITEIEIIAVGSKIRNVARLRKMYGKGRWRKLKGVAQVRLKSGRIRLAELHWLRSARHRAQGNQAQALFGLSK